MKAMRFTRIDHDAKLSAAFAKFGEIYAGVLLPTAYVQASEAWAAYIGDQMVGGFVIASGSAMRTPLIAPQEVLGSDATLSSYSRFSWAEVNMVWLADSVKSYATSLRFWLKIRERILKSGYSIFFIPWQLRNAGIDRFYRLFVSHVVYEGVPAGKGEHSVKLALGLATLSDIRWGTLKNVMMLLGKVFKNKKRAQRLAPVKEEGSIEGSLLESVKQ